MDTATKTDFGGVPTEAGTKSAGYSRQVAKCRIGFSRNGLNFCYPHRPGISSSAGCLPVGMSVVVYRSDTFVC